MRDDGSMNDSPDTTETGYDGIVCECGEAWFLLKGTAAPNGAVCMNSVGSITAYTGRPHCMNCGKHYLLTGM